MKKAIAIDFDGCLCVNKYPAIGAPNWAVIERAKREQELGAGLILWTCREGELLENAVRAAARWGLHFDAINESLPEWISAWGNSPRKVGATEYWDDRAVVMPISGVSDSISRQAAIDLLAGMLPEEPHGAYSLGYRAGIDDALTGLKRLTENKKEELK